MLNLNEEKKLWRKGLKRVAGFDEAGRGPLAGPVVAVAVTFNPKWASGNLAQMRDSKKLTTKKREELYKILTKNPAIEWGRGRVSEKVIDRINILEATKLAMKHAIKNLEERLRSPRYSIFSDRKKDGTIDFLIIDGNFKIDLPIPQKSIVKADEKVFSCKCASILAKVYRDRIMQRYHKKYPQYGFNQHKGYPTKYHLKILRKYGSCRIHRRSFGPVKACQRK